MSAKKDRGTAKRAVRSESAPPAGRNVLRLVCFLASTLLALGSGLFSSPPRDARVLQVKAVLDKELDGEEMTEDRVARWLCGASRVFNNAFGLRFDLKRFVSWTPPSSRLPLPRLMDEFLKAADAEGGDIVIGLVSADRTEGPSPGIASYAHGAVLLKELESDRLMTVVLVHELCHLFGAVDLKSSGSIMSTRNLALAFDDFTARIVSVHRSRTFGAAGRFLPDGHLLEALLIYRARAALDLGEVGLNLQLAGLCLAWDARRAHSSGALADGSPSLAVDWVGEAVRQCEKALASRPDWAAAEHLLDMALAREGHPERARASFARADDPSAGLVFLSGKPGAPGRAERRP